MDHPLRRFTTFVLGDAVSNSRARCPSPDALSEVINMLQIRRVRDESPEPYLRVIASHTPSATSKEDDDKVTVLDLFRDLKNAEDNGMFPADQRKGEDASALSLDHRQG